jgi:hypothetical protein
MNIKTRLLKVLKRPAKENYYTINPPLHTPEMVYFEGAVQIG